MPRRLYLNKKYTRDEIETGRKLFAGEWSFVAAAGSDVSLPPMRGVEIAFAGRSNVGKSSLVNALTNRKALARTSRTPAKSKIAAWTALIGTYLRGRANLARVYVLVDSRHGLKPTDDPMFHELGQAAVSYQVILTKSDAITAVELAARITEVEAALAKRPGAFPGVLVTSAHEGIGMEELRAAIARLLTERKL